MTISTKLKNNTGTATSDDVNIFKGDITGEFYIICNSYSYEKAAIHIKNDIIEVIFDEDEIYDIIRNQSLLKDGELTIEIKI